MGDFLRRLIDLPLEDFWVSTPHPLCGNRGLNLVGGRESLSDASMALVLNDMKEI